MSEKLASAEARQAAERAKAERIIWSDDDVEALIPIIADSYAAITDENERLRQWKFLITESPAGKISMERFLESQSYKPIIDIWRAKLEAAERLNRELVEALIQCKNVLKWLDVQGGLGHEKHKRICEVGELAEAAIKSATAKQGEVGK